MIEHPSIAGAVIAGGQATRMGGLNKPLQILAGTPLIRHAYERLQPQVAAVMINANRDLDEIAKILPKPTTISPDKQAFEGSGPLAGLQAALAFGRTQNFAFVATVAADTPFFPMDLVSKLANNDDCTAIRIARHDNYHHPLFGLWPVSVLADLEAFLRDGETYKVMAFAKRHKVISVDFEAAGDPFFNINTTDELKGAEKSMVRAEL